MGNLLTVNFWFNFSPGPLTPFIQKAFIAGILLFLLFAVGFKLITRLYKRSIFKSIWSKFYRLFLTDFFIGLLFLFFTYEQTMFFSSRFWFLLWFIVNIIWVYFIVRIFIQIPEKRRQRNKELEFKKYIP